MSAEEILNKRFDYVWLKDNIDVSKLIRAMIEYASQSQKEITDEEIEKWANERYSDHPVHQPAMRNAVIDSLKAMRDGKITNPSK